jgi:hypothetical protein
MIFAVVECGGGMIFAVVECGGGMIFAVVELTSLIISIRHSFMQ